MLPTMHQSRQSEANKCVRSAMHPQRPGHSSNVHLFRRSVIRHITGPSAWNQLSVDVYARRSRSALLQQCSQDVSISSFCRLKSRHARPRRLSRLLRRVRNCLRCYCYLFSGATVVGPRRVTVLSQLFTHGAQVNSAFHPPGVDK